MNIRPVRNHYDEWVKRALSLWLKELGDTQLDARVAGESRRIDVLFTERHHRPAVRRRLGELGEVARDTVAFEHFSRQPDPHEVKSCVTTLAREFRGPLLA